MDNYFEITNQDRLQDLKTDCYVGVDLDLDLKNPDKCENFRALCTLWIWISVKIQIIEIQSCEKTLETGQIQSFFSTLDFNIWI